MFCVFAIGFCTACLLVDLAVIFINRERPHDRRGKKVSADCEAGNGRDQHASILQVGLDFRPESAPDQSRT